MREVTEFSARDGECQEGEIDDPGYEAALGEYNAALLDDLWENGPSSEPVRLHVQHHGALSLMMDFLRESWEGLD